MIMAFDPPAISPTIQSTLRDIAETSSAYPFTVTSVACSAPATFDPDFHLPSPAPIDHRLLALGARPSLALQLSQAYQNAASRLKEASEAKWRNTIYACIEINRRFGVMSYDSGPLSASALSVYLRTLHDMEMRAMTSCRVYLFQQVSSTIPKSIVAKGDHTASFHLPPRRTWSFIKSDVASSCEGQYITAARPVSSADLLRFNVPPLMTAVEGHKNVNPRGKLPIWVVETDEKNNTQEVSAGGEGSTCTFPHRYTHHQPVASHSLPATSNTFFSSDSSPAMSRSPITSNKIDTLDSLSVNLHKLCLGTSAEHHATSPPPLEQRLKSPPQNNNPKISIGSAPRASKALGRKVAPMPRRTCLRDFGFEHGAALQSPGREAPASSSPTRPSHSNHSSSSLFPDRSCLVSSSQDTFSFSLPPSSQSLVQVTHSTVDSKQRKLAPFPRRGPISTSPSKALATSRKSSSSIHLIQEYPRPYAMSRAPSLVSLASTSDSPAPSDDDLDTPPSSPITRDSGLLTGLNRKPSVEVRESGLTHVGVWNGEDHVFLVSKTSPQAGGLHRRKTGPIVKQEPEWV